MSTPPGRPDNPDATMDFERPATVARPAPDQTVDQPGPPPAQDLSGGTLNYSSTDAPPVGQQTLDLPSLPGAEPAKDQTLQKTGMWDSVPGDAGAADFSLSSKAGVVFDPDAPAGEIDPLPDVPRVPGYEILGELGRGAMGVVYKARQVGLKRVVALKMILSGGHASRTEIVRFRTEAEAVARLQHPNIVQVFEIGEHRGLPFFSLEFVDGGCLADRLVDQPLPLREAALLVKKLALAMACAHEAGIVHRDLKPANILMTKDAEPKITDFGLAKKLEEDSGATRAGSIMGTPSYMAPEQAEGRPDLVGPHSDVYALGAILYDLLTGRPPFRGTTVLETLTQVRLVDPVPPARLLPQMSPDLETICLKCLNKEAPRRYTTARALAADLQRYLDGEPILARPVSSLERAWKWSRRNPAKAALVAVSVLSVLMLGFAGFALAAVQSKRRAEEAALKEVALEQRDRAKDRYRDARDAVDLMLTRIGETRLDNEPHMEQIRRELLEAAAGFYERFLKVEDPTPELRHDAAVASRKVGDIQSRLGRVKDAEESLQRSLSLLEALVTEFPEDATYRADLAAASINLANLLRESGRHKDAQQAFGRAIEMSQKLVEEAPGDVGRRRELAKAYYNHALVEEALQQSANAAMSLRSAREVLEKLVAEQPADAGQRQELARALTLYGQVKASQPADAEGALQQALNLLEGLVKADPDNRTTRQQLLVACNQMGDLLRNNRPEEAGTYFRRAVALGRGLVRDYPTLADYQKQLAGSLNGLALWNLAAGRRAEADKELAEAQRLKNRLVTTFPDRPDYRLDLAKARGNLGLAMQTAGQPERAMETYRDSLAELRDLVKEFPSNAAAYERELALGLVRLATLDAAAGEAATREALEIQGKLVERDPRSKDYRLERARTLQNLGVTLQSRREFGEAEKHLRQAEAELRDLVKRSPEEAEGRLELGQVLSNLCDLCRRTKRAKEGESLGTEAVAVLGELAKDRPTRPQYALEQTKALTNLGILFRENSRLGDAEARQREALAVRKALVERNSGEPALRKELASAHAELAIVLAARNNLKVAEEQFTQAIGLLAKLHAEEPASLSYIGDLITQHNNMAILLTGVGNENAAVGHAKQSVALKKKLAKLTGSAAAPLADVGRSLHELAGRLAGQKMMEEARATFEDAIRHQRRALAKDAKNVGYAANLRAHQMGLAEVLLAEGKHADSAKVIHEVVASAPADWPQYPAASLLLAKCVSAALADDKLDEGKRKESGNNYGEQAVAALRKAYQAGFRDGDAVKKMKEFAPLLEREDFSVRPDAAWEVELPLAIPLSAMHSFRSPHNEVLWRVLVHGDAVGRPPFQREFPLIVRPAGGRSWAA